MNVLELMQSIASHHVPHYMVWYGEEPETMKVYLQKILENGFVLNSTDSVSAAVQSTSKKSLLNKPTCFVVLFDEDYLKAESSWKQVENIFKQSRDILILKYQKLDKRGKFLKNNPCVEFEKMTDTVLANHLFEQLDLDDVTCEKLIHVCNNSYGRLLLEVDKIQRYAEATRRDHISVARDFVRDGIIHQDIGDITFLLTDSILVGDMNRAARYLKQAKEKGEPTIMVLSILYDNFKNMLIIQGLGSEKPTEENTGLKNNQIWAIKKKCGAYSNKELLRALKVTRNAEVALKTGLLDQEMALDYAALNIMK